MSLRRRSVVSQSRQTIQLDGRPISYLLRRTARARALRLTIDPVIGLVVTLPPEARRGWAHPNGRIESFLRERATWIARHLRRLERERAEVAALGGVKEGGALYYRGEIHRIRVSAAVPGARRSRVERIGAEGGDELVISVAPSDGRALGRVFEDWLRARATEAIERAVVLYAPGLGVTPAAVALRDPRTRWGSASRQGRLMFSWRLVLAPPESLETVVVHELAHLRVFGHGPGFWNLVASRRPDHKAERSWLRRHSHILHTGIGNGA